MRTTTGWLTSVVLALATTGCASLDRGGAAGSNTGHAESVARVAAERDVAADFLYALAQIEGYRPHEAVMRFSDATLASDPFTAALAQMMDERGYDVRTVSGGSALDSVRHDRREASADATVHTLSVGNVRMRRDYDVAADGERTPAGPLFVLGADVSGIRTERRRPAPVVAERPRDMANMLAPPDAVRVGALSGSFGDLD